MNFADIVCGLAWGDEAKGKITSQMSKSGFYDFVCRWSGGNNAGHTVYVEEKKYHTHLVPSGVFYGITSVIGPDCVLNIEDFFKEIEYLKSHGFDTSLVKVSPKTHIVTSSHISQDLKNLKDSQGTTGKGIAFCYGDKYLRKGKRVLDFLEEFKGYIWDEKLFGNVLCEGAQGFWLDINHGNYPFVSSGNPLPYGACSLGIPPQLIRNIFGAVKVYDTRVGTDPEFPDSLFLEKDLEKIGELGEEFGVTTGRKRKVNWLNLNKLIKAINLSGTNYLILSKLDVLEKLNIFKFIYENNIIEINDSINFKSRIIEILKKECSLLQTIVFSSDPRII